ncbi:MAG TPA: adenylate/guanylate cyclase domain-containing protein [Vicinamibacterales bacterium]
MPLRDLLEERLRPGADREAIDQRIWDELGEDWCVMATDLSGFSRGVAEFGIIHFLQTIYESERILVPILEKQGGNLLKIEGDSFLAIFQTAGRAVDASIEMQRAVREYNVDRIPEEQVLLGVGLGYGRVLRVSEGDVYGNEVNSACVLGETWARAYDILITKAVRDAVPDVAVEPFPHVPPGAREAFRVLY